MLEMPAFQRCGHPHRFFETSHPHLKVSVAHTSTRAIESIRGGVHWGEPKQAARHCRTPDFSLLELEIERRGD